MKFLIFLIGFMGISTALASPWDEGNRRKKIVFTLKAFSEASEKTLLDTYHYIHSIGMVSCTSPSQALKTNCLIEAAKRNCRQLRGNRERTICRFYSDIIIINNVSENSFLTPRERYEMMKAFEDYRSQFLIELERRYASLATEFRLSSHYQCSVGNDPTCLGEGIDQYCLEYADIKKLSWQGCVSSLIWFIGMKQRGESDG